MRVPSEILLCFHRCLRADRPTLQRFVRTFFLFPFQVIELRMAFVPQGFAHKDVTGRDIHLDPDHRWPAESWDMARWLELHARDT